MSRRFIFFFYYCELTFSFWRRVDDDDDIDSGIDSDVDMKEDDDHDMLVRVERQASRGFMGRSSSGRHIGRSGSCECVFGYFAQQGAGPCTIVFLTPNAYALLFFIVAINNNKIHFALSACAYSLLYLRAY